MLNIYITRHGQDEDNARSILNGQRDMPLTEKGIEQANEVAYRIQKTGLHFDQIYASPLQRAYKTAEIIAETLNIGTPKKIAALMERNFGEMSGKPIAQIEELCAPNILKTGMITYFLEPKDGETFRQLLERAKRVLELVEKQHQSGNILIVTHGDMGKMLYCAYYNLDWWDVLKMFHFGNSELLLMSPESPAEETHIIRIEQYNL